MAFLNQNLTTTNHWLNRKVIAWVMFLANRNGGITGEWLPDTLMCRFRRCDLRFPNRKQSPRGAWIAVCW